MESTFQVDLGDNHTVIGIPGEDGEDMCIQIDGDSVEVTDCEICMGEQEEEEEEGERVFCLNYLFDCT